MTYQKIEVTAEQRRNLIKLAQYLLTGVEDEDFSMSLFTVGLIGLPRATGIPGLEGETPFTYCSRVFGVTFKGPNDAGFRWMFSSNWIGADNTTKGASQRIIMFLTTGVPEVFSAAPSLSEKYHQGNVKLYRKIPTTWPEIVTAFPELHLPSE